MNTLQGCAEWGRLWGSPEPALLRLQCDGSEPVWDMPYIAGVRAALAAWRGCAAADGVAAAASRSPHGEEEARVESAAPAARAAARSR